MSQRELTHDEKKAAEAAFRGLGPDAQWSTAARKVYDRLIEVIPQSTAPLVQSLSREAEEKIVPGNSLSTEGQVQADHNQSALISATKSYAVLNDQAAKYATREEAVEAGVLIDISAQAEDMGLPLPVGMSKSLWDVGVTASDTISEDLYEDRVRDLLMALRIHLSRYPAVVPVSQFPALLSFPPNSVPQICAVCAMVHSERPDQHFLTLLLPSELPPNLKSSLQ